MKKIVITVCAVGLAAVAAQAQGVARDVNTFGQMYLDSKKASTQKVQAKKAQKRERAQMSQLEKKIRSEIVRQQAPLVYSFGAAGDANVYGRQYLEGQAVRTSQQNAGTETDTAVAGAKKTAPAKPVKTTDGKKKEERSLLSRIFGRRSHESEEDYKLRLRLMGYPSTQPFK